MAIARHHRFTAAVLVATFTASAAPAIAAPPKKPGKVAEPPKAKPKTIAERLNPEARKHWDSAQVLAGDDNFEAALTEFQAAYDLSKEPRVLLNVAVSLRKLKRYADAIVAMQRELAEGGADLEPELAEKLKQQIDEAMPLTTTLSVELAEKDADVTIDGRPVGKSPIAGEIRVDVGERTIVIKKAGFVDLTKKVTVAAATPIKVAVELEPVVKMGKLKVTSEGLPPKSGAHVVIDGADVGEVPWEGAIVAGRHSIEVSASGFITGKATRDVEWKGSVAVDVHIEKEKHEGYLVIETGVPTAIIDVDGKNAGAGGTFKGTLPSGGHTVSVTADGYKAYRGEVTILDNQSRSVNVLLEKNGGSSWVWWTIGAVVVAGGGVAAYFALKPKDEPSVPGTLGVISVPLFRH
jgi:hypothetical protein